MKAKSTLHEHLRHMKKGGTITMTVGQFKKVIKEISSDADEIKPGDLVDVSSDYSWGTKIRVLRMVPDVREETGVPLELDDAPAAAEFQGPGFVGIGTEESEGDWGPNEEFVSSLNMVVPGSKLKYYFPEDEYGRNTADLHLPATETEY
jgi:hypothetical protein